MTDNIRPNIDSREGFDAHTPTPEDWSEYEAWLDATEYEDDLDSDARNERPIRYECDGCGDEIESGNLCEDCENRLDYYGEDDGQPTEYEEWQDFYGGDDWDHGQYDCYEEY